MPAIPMTLAEIKELPVGTTVYRTLITTDGNRFAVHISECRIIDKDGEKRHVYVETGGQDYLAFSGDYSLADLGGVLNYANAFLTRDDAQIYRKEVFDGKHTAVVNDLKAQIRNIDKGFMNSYLKYHWK